MPDEPVGVRIGVDVGGTFTDGVLIDYLRKRVITAKVPTTPGDPTAGIQHVVSAMLQTVRIDLPDVAEIIHGTTLVANTIIERRGSKVALITTEGHRDVLEIGRETRYDIYDLDIERPAPLVRRRFRIGIRERILANGEIESPLDGQALREAVLRLVAEGIDSIAVAFLHSYANPIHEQEAVRIARSAIPGLDISASFNVAPEIREFERVSTVVANAYVRPIVRSYLASLSSQLTRKGYRGDLYVMTSDGGMITTATAAEIPIVLVESGPAGGVMGASLSAKQLGCSEVVSFDMGGTTAKIALIEDNKPTVARETEVARLQRFKQGSGLPLKVSTTELLEIGAGGGSIAWIDSLGLLKVGPSSAGADPGPACYGKGGVLPTVTDADLLLGFLDADYFLGGSMRLDVEAANTAIGNLAEKLGLSTIETAVGIYTIVNEYMARATRSHIIERGRDPMKYALLAFGGAGPVHAYGLARLLGISKVIIPPGASTASAFGSLVTPMVFNFQRCAITRLEASTLPFIRSAYDSLEHEARHSVPEGVCQHGEFERFADLRYHGQGYEIVVQVPPLAENTDWIGIVSAAFRKQYASLYGHVLHDLPLELVALRLRVTGQVTAPPEVQADDSLGVDGHLHRPVYFPGYPESRACSVVKYPAVRRGEIIGGPVIVEEKDTSVVVGPGARVEKTDTGALIITLPPRRGYR